jgi:hypothetical protein
MPQRLQYTAQVGPEYGAVILDAIYPATAQHIQKHTTQERHMVSCCQRTLLAAQHIHADMLLLLDWMPVLGALTHAHHQDCMG